MHNTTFSVLAILLRQGLTTSIVACDLSWQFSAKDTPQAQGSLMPIFGEYCLSKPLT